MATTPAQAPAPPEARPAEARGAAPRVVAVPFGALALGGVGGALGVAFFGPVPGVALGLAMATCGGLGAFALNARAALGALRAEADEARLSAASTLARDRAFFERLSQEFRTPLTLILAGFRALQEERETPLRVRREVAAAGLRNTARLLLVLHELGALAALEPGQRAPRKRVIDLAALLRRVSGNFSASGVGRTLSVAGLDAPLSVEVDPHQIQTVLYAILSNAFQRTDPTTGSILLTLEARGDAVVLCVADNGGPPGLESGLESTVTERGSPGLGLAVVRELVNAHRGQLDVRARGEGMAVTVSLPRGPATDRPATFLDESTEVLDFLHRLARPSLPEEDSPTEEGEGPLDPTRTLVLVVASNEDLRAWIRRVLGTRFAVATASDLASARERAHEVRPDLLVVDADAPQDGGATLVAEVRRDPVLCATPILGLLARTAGRSGVDPEGLAADDYLPMPFEEEELLARAGNLVRSRTQAEEIAVLRRQLEARVEEQIRELIRTGQLRRYLPQALLEGSLHRPVEEDEEGSEVDRRWVTVVYCALHGFSELAERLAPGDLARLLNTWAREVGAEAASASGVVDQHFGDALILLFGLPDSAKPVDQSQAAVRAALAIQSRTRALAEHWHRYGLPRGIDLRTGIHGGLALVGVLGSELTARYTAFGPAVHVAAKLAAEPSNPGLLISFATYAHVRSQVESAQAGTVKVEGLSRPVETYAVKGMKAGSA